MKNRLLLINTVCYGSTGKIMHEIQSVAIEKGYETLALYGRGNGYDLPCAKFGNFVSFWSHVVLTTLTDKQGQGSIKCTKQMIQKIKEFNPTIIYMHNIHGYYLNYLMLFNYLKNEYKGRVIWTLHDCWSFTGHCAHFDQIGCDKWKKQCFKCQLKKTYPISLFQDNSFKNYLLKKDSFTGIKNMLIVTPSKWLEEKVNQSFLKEYEVKTIYNGIDTTKFISNKDFNVLSKYNIPNNKKILLSVANIWDNSKGLDKYIELSYKLNNNFIIVLVGMTKKQIKKMPTNIIGIERTNNVNDLICLYSLADKFLNFTQADTFPTVNLEAISCGTPVLTLDTGGCKEQIKGPVGKVISYKNALDELVNYDNNSFNNTNWKNDFDIKKFRNSIKEII